MSCCLCDCPSSRVAAFSVLLHPIAHASAQVAWLGRKHNAKQIYQVCLPPSQPSRACLLSHAVTAAY